ncbi:hypothetical protein F511_37746 [Dorcoceras hygrometricum]|uniref:Uncharacterized protein n=1 Tax=Dorcoceras hygrometricum TaxID=472368 RepID=A0A2Z7B5I6_9LAMI|nr:hypothetical protein F511_37746 [Dorcoceras hygrometricum]
MVSMFKSLVAMVLEGFQAPTGSVYGEAVLEFFDNAEVITGTIVSSVANSKLAPSKEIFSEAFGLPTAGMVGFLDSERIVVEMRGRLSGSDVPFCAPSKKKEMKMEFLLLHDLLAKVPCVKDGSFDMVTSKNFDLIVAISAGLKVNWAQILFNTLLAMVNNPTRQSQGYAIQISVLLENLVKADLGESVKMQTQKVLTTKSVVTYVKKNLKVWLLVGQETRVVEKKKAVSTKKKADTTEVDNKKKKRVKKVVTSQTVEAGRKVAPAKSSSQTNSDLDSRPWGVQKKRGGTKHFGELEEEREEAAVCYLFAFRSIGFSVQPSAVVLTHLYPDACIEDDRQYRDPHLPSAVDLVLELLWLPDSFVHDTKVSQLVMEMTQLVVPRERCRLVLSVELAFVAVSWCEVYIYEKTWSLTGLTDSILSDIFSRFLFFASDPRTLFTVAFLRQFPSFRSPFSTFEVVLDSSREALSFYTILGGKGMLEVVARHNLVKEHCQLLLNTAWEDVSSTMAAFDEWMNFRTVEQPATKKEDSPHNSPTHSNSRSSSFISPYTMRNVTVCFFIMTLIRVPVKLLLNLEILPFIMRTMHIIWVQISLLK